MFMPFWLWVGTAQNRMHKTCKFCTNPGLKKKATSNKFAGHGLMNFEARKLFYVEQSHCSTLARSAEPNQPNLQQVGNFSQGFEHFSANRFVHLNDGKRFERAGFGLFA